MPTLAELPQKRTIAAIPSGLRLRCFAYRQKENLFVAECIDLNLMVKAKSLNRAVSSLNEAVLGYLTVASDGDPAGLIPRPSPLSRRIVYRYMKIQAALCEMIGWHDAKQGNKSRRFSYFDCHSAA